MFTSQKPADPTGPFNAEAFIIRSPQPSPADIPGTLPRENRAAILDGFIRRPELPGDGDASAKDEADHAQFFEMQEGDDPEASEQAELAWLFHMQGRVYFIGEREEMLRELHLVSLWTHITIISLACGPDTWVCQKVDDDELDAKFPGWREWSDQS